MPGTKQITHGMCVFKKFLRLWGACCRECNVGIAFFCTHTTFVYLYCLRISYSSPSLTSSLYSFHNLSRDQSVKLIKHLFVQWVIISEGEFWLKICLSSEVRATDARSWWKRRTYPTVHTRTIHIASRYIFLSVFVGNFLFSEGNNRFIFMLLLLLDHFSIKNVYMLPLFFFFFLVICWLVSFIEHEPRSCSGVVCCICWIMSSYLHVWKKNFRVVGDDPCQRIGHICCDEACCPWWW